MHSAQLPLCFATNLCGKVTFLGDDRSHDEVGMVLCGPFGKACGALPEAVPCAIFCLFEAKRQTFLAKRQTFWAKHTPESSLMQQFWVNDFKAIFLARK